LAKGIYINKKEPSQTIVALVDNIDIDI
jgi:hypothetical protein